MYLSLTIPVFVMGMMGYIQYYQTRRSSNRISSSQLGLKKLELVRKLLEHVPQHRGVANAVLQGDESFRSKLAALQSRIDTEINMVHDADSGQDARYLSTRLQNIAIQWEDIKRNLTQLSAAESFRKHTDLIAEITYVISDVGEASGLFLNLDQKFYGLIDATINKLPLVTEFLGQARGLGMGVAAAGKCTIANKVKLAYRHKKVSAVWNDAEHAIKKALQYTPELKAIAENKVNNNKNSISNFLAILNAELLQMDKIKIAPDVYFNAGTEAIQDSFALLDVMIDILQSQLVAKARLVSKKVFWSSVFGSISIVPMISYLYLAL